MTCHCKQASNLQARKVNFNELNIIIEFLGCSLLFYDLHTELIKSTVATVAIVFIDRKPNYHLIAMPPLILRLDYKGKS